jgi:DNA-binding beta-propeller fold protein YncE
MREPGVRIAPFPSEIKGAKILVNEVNVMKRMTWGRVTAISLVIGVSLGVLNPLKIAAQEDTSHRVAEGPKFKVDPFWPKPLPDRWVFGELGGVCLDAQDHVFILSRGDLWPKEALIAQPAPPVIEFDPDGNVVNSWGDRAKMPKTLHGCFVDYQGNIWIAGRFDGIVQKYTHDGSKMLLQIGTKGKFDSADGTDSQLSGTPSYAMNSSHELLNSPTDIAVDPTNGDVYISDGYANRRVVVFDREGHYLRQWGRQGSLAEIESGVGGVFLNMVHCVVIGNDGLVYVCDRQGDRIEVFSKMGEYKSSMIVVGSWGAPPHSLPGGTCDLAFSADQAQKFAYVADCTNDQVHILDRATGVTLSNFGRPGQAAGDISSPHGIAVDSKGNIYIVGSLNDRRLQKFALLK